MAQESPFVVLFCGQHFTYGLEQTRRHLADAPGVEVRCCLEGEVGDHIGSAHVAVPMYARFDAQLLARARRLRLILQYGVGVEGVDIPEATRRGVWVSNIPSEGTGNAASCAEMAIFLALACLRSFNQLRQSIRDGVLSQPAGRTLAGATVLVVGYGHIARALVPRLKPFGARLLGVRRSPWAEEGEAALLDERGPWGALHSLAGRADVVVLACACTPGTVGLVDGAFLAACKPGVIIVNVTRGGLLDEEAVWEGLQSGAIGSLGLDVLWREPCDPSDRIICHPRVITTPHVAGVTRLSHGTMAGVVAAEVRRCQAGLPPTVQLNQPASS